MGGTVAKGFRHPDTGRGPVAVAWPAKIISKIGMDCAPLPGSGPRRVLRRAVRAIGCVDDRSGLRRVDEHGHG
jgi:hypothetical protein